MSICDDPCDTGHEVEIDAVFLLSIIESITLTEVVCGFLYFGVGGLGLEGHFVGEDETAVLVQNGNRLISDGFLFRLRF